jgi:hypothetical protein
MTSVDWRRTQPFCTPDCSRQCRCSRWPDYVNRFGQYVAADKQYANKVLNLNHCLINPAQNGTYSSDVATWPVGTGIGDGNTAPMFDGTNDYVNAFTAALAAAFNESAGTLLHWIRLAAGVWTDGTRRDSAFIQADANNYVFTGRDLANNLYRFYYTANAVPKNVNPVGLTTYDWVLCGLTWDAAVDEVKVYWNGVQTGATQNGLGVWNGGALTVAVIGATTVVPNNPFHGRISHVQLYDRALSGPTIAELASVS